MSGPLCVLIIDDDEGNAESLAMLLNLWGHNAVTTLSALDGLEKVHLLEPDLILADIAMPRLSGTDFARELRKIPKFKETPLVAITGVRGQEKACRRAGFNHFFLKPLDFVALRCLMDSLS